MQSIRISLEILDPMTNPIDMMWIVMMMTTNLEKLELSHILEKFEALFVKPFQSFLCTAFLFLFP